MVEDEKSSERDWEDSKGWDRWGRALKHTTHTNNHIPSADDHTISGPVVFHALCEMRLPEWCSTIQEVLLTRTRRIHEHIVEGDRATVVWTSPTLDFFVFRAGFSPHTHGQSFEGERPESFTYEYSHRQCCILAREYGRSIDTLSHVRTSGHQELRTCIVWQQFTTLRCAGKHDPDSQRSVEWRPEMRHECEQFFLLMVSMVSGIDNVHDCAFFLHWNSVHSWSSHTDTRIEFFTSLSKKQERGRLHVWCATLQWPDPVKSGNYIHACLTKKDIFQFRRFVFLTNLKLILNLQGHQQNQSLGKVPFDHCLDWICRLVHCRWPREIHDIQQSKQLIPSHVRELIFGERVCVARHMVHIDMSLVLLATLQQPRPREEHTQRHNFRFLVDCIQVTETNVQLPK